MDPGESPRGFSLFQPPDHSPRYPAKSPGDSIPGTRRRLADDKKLVNSSRED
jgi:hypothetical protein